MLGDYEESDLKGAIISTRPPQLLKDVLERRAPFQHSWESGNDSSEKVYESILEYGQDGSHSDLSLFTGWCLDLLEIARVSDLIKEAGADESLSARIAARGHAKACARFFGDTAVTTQMYVGWLFAHDHDDLYKEIKEQAEHYETKHLKGLTFKVIRPIIRPRFDKAKTQFKRLYIACMARRFVHVEDLFIEHTDFGDCERFTIKVPPSPHDVDKIRSHALVRETDENVIRCTIVYYPKNNYFILVGKQKLGIRRAIAAIFAMHILGTQLEDSESSAKKEADPIVQLNPEGNPGFRFTSSGSDISSCKTTGIWYTFRETTGKSGHGNLDTPHADAWPLMCALLGIYRNDTLRYTDYRFEISAKGAEYICNYSDGILDVPCKEPETKEAITVFLKKNLNLI